MDKQNILIGAMAVAIAALSIVTYQQQNYIQQLAASQQSGSVSKEIKKLNRRVDNLESQIDSAYSHQEEIDALRSDLEELNGRLSGIENAPSQVEWHNDLDIDELENRVNSAESDIHRLKDRTNTFP